MLALRRWAGLGSFGLLILAQFLQVSAQAQTAEPSDQRFTCEVDLSGDYTVMYRPETDPTRAYSWAKPGEMGGGWTEELRCQTISARLEQYRPEGLIELRTGVENGYDIVCATTEATPDQCRIVFTVPPGQDAIATRDAVFDNLALAENGTATDAVTTFSGSGSWINDTIDQVLGSGVPTQPTRRSAINLKPFLDPADGGTGEALGLSSRRLNPENFR